MYACGCIAMENGLNVFVAIGIENCQKRKGARYHTANTISLQINMQCNRIISIIIIIYE